MAGALAAAVLAGPVGSATAATATATATATGDIVAARAGASWLARQIDANGGYLLSPKKTPSATDTVDALLALHAAGVGATADRRGLAWLRSGPWKTYVAGTGSDSPGNLAKLVLLAHAAGIDPHDFAGAPGSDDDLVARLKATEQPTGLFGSAPPTYDGAFRQGLSLAALAAAGEKATNETSAIGWLTAQQCADGGWQAFRADPSKPCPAPDPASYSGPDTNSTAMAVMGLRAIGGADTASAVRWLRSVQGDDAGWGYYTTGGTTSADPNSTGLVLSALASAGVPASSLAKNGRTPGERLRDFQLGASAPADQRGAFWFDLGDGSRKPNVAATAQAVPGLAGAFLPYAPASLTDPAPVPSATPSPTPSSPRPSASPVPSRSGPPVASGPTLPPTGASPTLAGLGLALVLLGAVTVLLTRARARGGSRR